MIFPKLKSTGSIGIKILFAWFLIQSTMFNTPSCFAEEEVSLQENLPSNEEFLRESLRSLFGQTFDDFPKGTSQLIFLKAEEDHPANWLLEDELVSYLLSLKYQVGLRSTDSSYNLSESSSLFYRIIELKLDYSQVKRKGFWGRRMVTRKSSLNLAFRLTDAVTGKVLWSKRGKEEKSDIARKSMIKSLNNESYPFLSPPLPGDSQSKYLEPALVAAVVGGLIYLFFANR